MAPTTRSSARKTAVTDARDIISWTSAVTGEELYYERFHAYEEEGEVLFVQMRMNEHGELVLWTTEDEDEEQDIRMSDDNDNSEETEIDPDFVPESEEAEVDLDFMPEAPRTQRRQITKVNKTVPLSVASYNAQVQPVTSLSGPSQPVASLSAPSQPVFSLSALHPAPALNPVQRKSCPAAHLNFFVTQFVNSCLPTGSYPADIVNDVAELVEGEFILDLAIGPLSENVLLATSQSSLPSLLRNFWVSNLVEINGARAHAVEKEAYDLVRPGKVVNGRWVLDPRNNIFRPTNPEYKALAGMGP